MLRNMTALLVFDLALFSLLLLHTDLGLLRFVDLAQLESGLIRSKSRIGSREPISFERGDLVELNCKLREAIVLFRIYARASVDAHR